MLGRLSSAALLAAAIALPLAQDVSYAEPLRVSLARAKTLPTGPRRVSVAPMLPDRQEFRLSAMPLASPAQPGRRLGYSDVVFWLPIGEWRELRTGLRVDCENRPRGGRWEPEEMPTVGIGFRF